MIWRSALGQAEPASSAAQLIYEVQGKRKRAQRNDRQRPAAPSLQHTRAARRQHVLNIPVIPICTMDSQM